MEIHASAHRHGIGADNIRHALEHPIVVVDLDPAGDPPKVLAIGPDLAANLLEVIWLELDEGVDLVIHAMSLRPKLYGLLPTGEDQP